MQETDTDCGEYYLSAIELEDKEAYAEYLNDKVFNETLHFIPYPYTEIDAKRWIEHIRSRRMNLKDWTLAIRKSSDNKLIGEIGIYHSQLGSNGAVEISYWLAKHHWGQGIVTQAMLAFLDYCFEELDINCIFARVFDNNRRSWRVLEKTGFTFQGTFYNHLSKDDKYLNDRVYKILKDDWVKFNEIN